MLSLLADICRISLVQLGRDWDSRDESTGDRCDDRNASQRHPRMRPARLAGQIFLSAAIFKFKNIIDLK